MFGSLSTKIAHSTITPALGNQDLRLLQESINKEKELVTSVQRFSRDLGNSADALKQWAAGEGEDLSDVANGSLLLTTHIISALNTFADHETVIRSQLKEIRTKEEQLEELRRRRKVVGSKLEAQEKRLSKMGSENKGLSQATEQLSSLQTELRQLDTSILVDMARMSDYKRNAMRSSLTLKFGGLVELGEKLTIIGEIGKLVATEVPQDVTPPGQGRAPYPGREAVSNLVAEAARCVQEVTFNANPDTEFSARPASRLHGTGSSAHHGEGGPPPEGMRRPTATGELDIGPGGSRFKEQSYSSQLTPQPSFTSSNMAGGGTMPPIRDYGGGPGLAPVDEFGRPIDGLPMSANTMPAMGGGGNSTIQHMPLSAIQQSMRGPTSPGGQDTYAPSQNNPSGFHPPGPSPQVGHSQFQAPPPPPNANPSHPSQQEPGVFQNSAASQTSMQAQDPSGSRFNQQYPQGRSGALDRGLTLSLPLRERSPGSRKPVPEENEMESPFVPPNAAPSGPSAFKPPAPQITRQGTTDSDIVLGEGEADLQRTTTLPPKVGLGGDFPEWSLGLEELGLGGSPVKEVDTEGLGKLAADAGEKKDLPEPPATETRSSFDRSPISAVPRSLREEGNTSQTSSPITQTPTTYSNTQTPTAYTPATTSPEGPRIIHDHVVDNPNTRTSGNSGRFAMFPDKRKVTVGPSSERGDSAASDALVPPHAKFSSHPGVDRTPSPYPAGVSPGVSPLPTPGYEKQGEILPINVGHPVTPTPPDDRDGFVSPATAGTEGPPRSILLDGAHSRAGSVATTDSNAPGRLRFAPRPPSPITPSPVTPGNPAWASVDSLGRGDGVGPIGKAASTSTSSPAYMEAGQGRPEHVPIGDAQKSDNRLSVITPLGIHKNKEGGSRPTTPNQGPSTMPRSEMTDDQFNEMLDSFAAQVGSPSSNPPSGVESANSSRFSSGPNDSSRSYPENSLNNSQGPSHVKNFLSSSGEADSSRGGSSSAQESSLDSTAAHAGSPFPSPTPTSQAPSQGYKLADMPRRGGYGELDGNVAGVGSSAFRRDGGIGHRRVGSGGSDTYYDSSSKVISAGAFRRTGGKASPAARSSPAISPAASPRQSYQVAPPGSSAGAISTPRQDYNPVSPATSQNFDYGGGPGSNYQTAQSTPNPIPGDRSSLPPGAAAPSRFGGQPSEPAYQQRDPRTIGGHPDLYTQGRASPTQISSPTTRIPTSLIPGRPGTASPLAPIGHNQPPPTSGYMPPPGPPGSYAPPSQGYSQAVPPWQQQQQQRPPQQGYQLHSPAPTEFEGSVAHQDAYGGIEEDAAYPTGQAGRSGQWGGAPRYGQGSWNGR